MCKTATSSPKSKSTAACSGASLGPKIGKGRNRQFFKDKIEAQTVLRQKGAPFCSLERQFFTLDPRIRMAGGNI
jgi:hypothetical protein